MTVAQMRGFALGHSQDMIWNFRKLKNNTYGWEDAQGIRYIGFHHTVILTIWPSGTVCIQAGGYSHSPTTRGRINDYQNQVRLYQKDELVWVERTGPGPTFSTLDSGQMTFDSDPSPVLFYEGMTILPNAALTRRFA
jgi:hypothetical protein